MQQSGSELHKYLVEYGLDIGFLISGFFGALLLATKNKSQKIGTSLICIAAGTACANYLTPVVLNFAPNSIKTEGKFAVAFMMGFMGLKGLELFVDVLSEYILRVKRETKAKDKTP
jgi:hypothetical protein